MFSTRFDRATAVVEEGANRYLGHIDPEWFVFTAPNGGYLAAMILRALTAAVHDENRAPRALTVHYLAVAEPGAAAIEVRIERAGKTMTTLSARVSQQDKVVALALAAFAAPFDGLSFPAAPMPVIPPPEELTAQTLWDAFSSNVRQYAFYHAIGAPLGSGADEARLGGWLRLVEPRLADALLVAAYTDAWPPSIYPRLREMAMAPTLDLTVHFRARLPLEGATPEDYYLTVFESRHAAEGFFEEDGTIWSRSGVLIAQSHQLAMVRPLRS